MKKTYPNYQSTGVMFIEKTLKPKDKKILNDFLKYCRITAGEKKINDYKREMLKVYDIIEKPYYKITKEDVQGFLGLLNQADLEKWTKNTIKIMFKKFLRWYYKDLEMLEDIKGEYAFNEKRINESTLVKPEEVEKLIRTAQSLKWKAIITLLSESACRPQELRQLLWKDIKFNDDGSADVTLYSGKTRKARTIPIKDCVIHLKRWKEEYTYPELRNDDFVFPSINGRDKMMCADTLPRQFKRFCEKAGIRNIFPYLFRHTRLTYMYNNLPEQVVKKYAGHSADSEMALIYSHISNKNMKDVILKEIYPTEELTEEEKDRYEKAINELKKDFIEQQEVLEGIQSDNKKIVGMYKDLLNTKIKQSKK